MSNTIKSIPGICDVQQFGDARGDAPTLLIELPHGATAYTHFEALRQRLEGALPDDLEAFFFVNTDVGTPECARQIGETLAEAKLSTLILRCLLPRTLVDCNRVVHEEPPAEGAAMTAGIPDYITSDADRRLLIDVQRQYHELTGSAYRQVMSGKNTALALQLHSYAPKSVSIDTIDDGIVAALREAYKPEQYAKWDNRPQVELITETKDGRFLSPRDAVASVCEQFAQIGIEVAQNASYRLHPDTWGYRYAARYPGRVLCVELNRGLLATPFTPFEEMTIGGAETARLARPLAQACADYLRAGSKACD